MYSLRNKHGRVFFKRKVLKHPQGQSSLIFYFLGKKKKRNQYPRENKCPSEMLTFYSRSLNFWYVRL